MLDRQRGLSLAWVTIFSALFALASMAAVFSMRYERNLFAEAWEKVAGGATRQAMDAASKAAGAGQAGTVLRKCVIAGKTVVSNTDCADDNKTSTRIAIHDTRGIEAPKPPVAEQVQPGSDPVLDKIVEKQTR